GVAFARTALAAWNIINGRLVRPIQCFFENAQHALDRLSEGRLRAYQRSQRSENGCWPRRPTMGAPPQDRSHVSADWRPLRALVSSAASAKSHSRHAFILGSIDVACGQQIQ